MSWQKTKKEKKEICNVFFFKKITNLSKYPGKIKRIRIQIQENVDGTRIHIQEMCSTIQDANLGKIKRIQIKSNWAKCVTVIIFIWFRVSNRQRWVNAYRCPGQRWVRLCYEGTLEWAHWNILTAVTVDTVQLTLILFSCDKLLDNSRK